MSNMSVTKTDSVSGQSTVSAVYPPRSKYKISAIKIIFCLLLMVLAIELAVYKIVLPGIGRPEIAFSGAQAHTAAELSTCIAPLTGVNWFLFDARQAERLIAASPSIAYAEVKKQFPNRIVITVTEREPVAMTFLKSGGRSVPVEIDKNGVLFAQRVTRADGVPIISGLPIEHLSEGMRIPAKYRMLIEQIAGIRALPQQYFAAISEICVLPKEYGNYELVLIPAHSRIRVLTDRALNEDALQYMMVVLDVVNSIEPNVSEIDLRYGSVSYRTR